MHDTLEIEAAPARDRLTTEESHILEAKERKILACLADNSPQVFHYYEQVKDLDLLQLVIAEPHYYRRAFDDDRHMMSQRIRAAEYEAGRLQTAIDAIPTLTRHWRTCWQ